MARVCLLTVPDGIETGVSFVRNSRFPLLTVPDGIETSN